MIRILAICLLSTSTALANCPSDQDHFLSCRIEGQGDFLRVCYDENAAYYHFGSEGGPAELSLSETYDQLEYTPWPGVGQSIWERLTFQNGEYRYVVTGGFDRMFGDETDADHPHPHFGSVEVFKGPELLTTLICDRTTASFMWPDQISTYKENAGFKWDERERQWIKRP